MLKFRPTFPYGQMLIGHHNDPASYVEGIFCGTEKHDLTIYLEKRFETALEPELNREITDANVALYGMTGFFPKCRLLAGGPLPRLDNCIIIEALDVKSAVKFFNLTRAMVLSFDANLVDIDEKIAVIAAGFASSILSKQTAVLGQTELICQWFEHPDNSCLLRMDPKEVPDNVTLW
jgi:hypothetical protein